MQSSRTRTQFQWIMESCAQHTIMHSTIVGLYMLWLHRYQAVSASPTLQLPADAEPGFWNGYVVSPLPSVAPSQRMEYASASPVVSAGSPPSFLLKWQQ